MYHFELTIRGGGCVSRNRAYNPVLPSEARISLSGRVVDGKQSLENPGDCQPPTGLSCRYSEARVFERDGSARRPPRHRHRYRHPPTSPATRLAAGATASFHRRLIALPPVLPILPELFAERGVLVANSLSHKSISPCANEHGCNPINEGGALLTGIAAAGCCSVWFGGAALKPATCRVP